MSNEQIFNSIYTGEEMDSAFSVALGIANHMGIPKGTGNGSIQILPVDTDRLTSDGERIPTSAVVAKAIAAARKVSEVFVYKGIVQTINDLPSDAKPGFVYIVVQEDNENYAWDGVNWTPVGKVLAPIAVNNVSPDETGNVTITASDVGALAVSGGTMTGPINMNQQALSGLKTPTADDEAVPKEYADTKLPCTGGTMTGPIDMNGSSISGLNDPTEDSQAARKGYVDGIIGKIYPVGAIYLSVNSTSPATLFGGTWEQLKGRFLLGAGKVDENTNYPAGSTGGESEHTLTQNEIPKHFHGAYLLGMGGTDTTPAYYAALNQSAYTYNYELGVSGVSESAIVGPKGGGTSHNNMPPYLAVYMWKRVA